MITHAEQTPEDKAEATSNLVAQTQHAVGPVSASPDNCPASVAQQKLQYAIKNGPVAQKKANRDCLPDLLKTGIENLSGYATDNVTVHYNSDKPAQLSAHAYARGSQIHLAPGQEKHLPHEAWHVIQQKQGRVKPTMQMKGKVNVNDDVMLEQEADVMGRKAIHNNLNPEPSKGMM